MVDVKCLSDNELQNELDKLGFSPGPILQLNVTIILKGNIILSSEKNKGPKKRPKASTRKPRALESFYLDSKHSEGRRCAARASNIRFKAWNNIREKACCIGNRRARSRNPETFPVGLKLAVFGIFIIVIFVYITVERKPLFG
ncbi:LEM domain-containing protein 1 [Hippopotamus amphibius kiboko]|uniref:LEM domain-containing protein 1 n=1 Tax=Hippopotamus amphibius kiboko TaxID=575201 RepID=UPI002595271D|nr:LEM domain-containing protein 1 [Hippopotamus amphibius kiboko]